MNKVVTYVESLFLTIAEWLGVKYFKKYWIVGGSYWRSYHINPKNKNDLLNVIHFTRIHSMNHVIIILFEICWILYTSKCVYLYYVLASTTLHSYAFMIQGYNYILAKSAMNKLDMCRNKFY